MRIPLLVCLATAAAASAAPTVAVYEGAPTSSTWFLNTIYRHSLSPIGVIGFGATELYPDPMNPGLYLSTSMGTWAGSTTLLRVTDNYITSCPPTNHTSYLTPFVSDQGRVHVGASLNDPMCQARTGSAIYGPGYASFHNVGLMDGDQIYFYPGSYPNPFPTGDCEPANVPVQGKQPISISYEFGGNECWFYSLGDPVNNSFVALGQEVVDSENFLWHGGMIYTDGAGGSSPIRSFGRCSPVGTSIIVPIKYRNGDPAVVRMGMSWESEGRPCEEEVLPWNPVTTIVEPTEFMSVFSGEGTSVEPRTVLRSNQPSGWVHNGDALAILANVDPATGPDFKSCLLALPGASNSYTVHRAMEYGMTVDVASLGDVQFTPASFDAPICTTGGIVFVSDAILLDLENTAVTGIWRADINASTGLLEYVPVIVSGVDGVPSFDNVAAFGANASGVVVAVINSSGGFDVYAGDGTGGPDRIAGAGDHAIVDVAGSGTTEWVIDSFIDPAPAHENFAWSSAAWSGGSDGNPNFVSDVGLTIQKVLLDDGVNDLRGGILWIRLCRADFNGDGTVDFFDHLDFVDAFTTSDPTADFNSDGVVDMFDYLDFTDIFSSPPSHCT